MTILIPINNEVPVKEFSRGFVTKETNDQSHGIELYKVFERHYDHPDAIGMALVPNIEVDRLFICKPTDKLYPAVYLLHMANKNVANLLPK